MLEVQPTDPSTEEEEDEDGSSTIVTGGIPADDPYASKKSPDTPGLAPQRPRGRLLRKGPIAAMIIGTLVLAVVAGSRGLTSPPVTAAVHAKPQPIEPQAPVEPNLEISDVVKTAPGNDAPVLIPKSKIAAGPPSAPSGSSKLAGAESPPSDPLTGPSPSQPGSAAPMGAVSAATEERRARLEARRAERARAIAGAMFPSGEGFDQIADLQPGGTGTGAGAPRAGAAPAAPSAGYAGPGMAQPGAATLGEQGGRAVTSGAGSDADPTGQAQKRSFLTEGATGAARGYSVSHQAVTPYRMRAGWAIPCALQVRVNSDLPGMVVAMVTENVYDSVSGQHLLVPQGATITGPANSSVAYGQERAQVCWSTLERDDGVVIDLGCSPAYDQSGAAGLADEVDNHYGKLITGITLSALLSAGTQAVAGDMQNYRPSVAQGFAIGAALEFGAAGQQLTRKNMNIQPTIKIRNGWPAIVLLEKPVVVPPYRVPGKE